MIICRKTQYIPALGLFLLRNNHSKSLVIKLDHYHMPMKNKVFIYVCLSAFPQAGNTTHQSLLSGPDQSLCSGPVVPCSCAGNSKTWQFPWVNA